MNLDTIIANIRRIIASNQCWYSLLQVVELSTMADRQLAADYIEQHMGKPPCGWETEKIKLWMEFEDFRVTAAFAASWDHAHRFAIRKESEVETPEVSDFFRHLGLLSLRQPLDEMELRGVYLANLETPISRLPSGIPDKIRDLATYLIKITDEITARETEEFRRSKEGKAALRKESNKRRRVAKIKERYDECAYREPSGRWAGGRVVVSPRIGPPQVDTRTMLVWSDNRKWSGNDLSVTMHTRANWETTVDKKGISVVDGMLTLSAKGVPVQPTWSDSQLEEIAAYKATWIKQGKGLSLDLAEGYIISAASSAHHTLHAKTLQGGLRAMKRRLM